MKSKKNLDRGLAAASSGADIIELGKVAVEFTDYARREYGAAPEQVAALEKGTHRRYRKLQRSGELVTVTAEQLKELIG
jgi:hypothetical protein